MRFNTALNICWPDVLLFISCFENYMFMFIVHLSTRKPSLSYIKIFYDTQEKSMNSIKNVKYHN